MYPTYFGLSEPPFSITPDPHYLFLSPRHQEALAHLLYGAGENGGFVQLTGEVGTGKTMVCRAFLEQLPDPVDVALILNPTLSVPELLHAICDEFGVQVPPGKVSNKALVDLLNRYLLDSHARGRRPLLMIDEAQNLSAEVLEQIRLLTNLETPKHKLLQIFLVGQPELRDLLEQPRLRQVAQRITARYHLQPLNRLQTGHYIHHRLAVAGASRDPFSRAAVRRIHRFSGGVPRLINILCDRALLGAYATQRQEVTLRIVKKAARELMLENRSRTNNRYRPAFQIIGATVIVFVGIGLVASSWKSPPDIPVAASGLHDEAGSQRDAHPTSPSEPPAGELGVVSTPAVPHQPPSALPTVMATSPPPAPAPTEPPASIERLGVYQRPALTRLFARWGIDFPLRGAEDPCRFAESRGLRCLKGKGSWAILRRYNRPTLLQIHLNEADSTFIVVSGLDASRVVLDLETTHTALPLNALKPSALGRFLLLWKPPVKDTRIIGRRSSPEAILWLRHALDQVPGFSVPDQTSPVYDAALKSEVIRFQGSRGLITDGIVGPETLIQINTATQAPGIPTLDRAATEQ